MYENHLIQAGLSKEQAEIYEILAKSGQITAGNLNKNTPIKRGLVYKVLDQLIELDLVEKEEEPQKVAKFRAKHPLKLKELAQKREQQAKDAQLALEGVLPSITSDFNLSIGRPGIQFFEGLDGARKVWWDSLNSKTPIYTYGDLEKVVKNFGEINKQYVKERIKRQIKKMAITNDSPFNRKTVENYDQEFTETRLIKNSLISFADVVVEIYDNKISYTTLKEGSLISIIIEDPLIYQMNKNLFEYHWHILGQKGQKEIKTDKAAPTEPTELTKPTVIV